MKKVEQKVIEFIERHSLLRKGDNILVALSGGPDSIFAISFFQKFQKKFQIDLGAVHINHNLRGRESDKDEKFVQNYCLKNGIKFHLAKVDVKKIAKENKLSIEEAARNARYRLFNSICDEYGYNRIVTAHNLDDNTETVLLNLLSGTGINGISGIPISRDRIIRPILCLTKNEILSYLKSRAIKFRIDKTNLKNDFKRNFLRNRVIPLISKSINPSLNDAVFRTSKTIESVLPEVEDFVNSAIEKYFSFDNKALIVDATLFKNYSIGFVGEAIKKSLRKYFNVDFSFQSFTKLEKLSSAQKGKKATLSSKLVAFREENNIKIIENQNAHGNISVNLKVGESVKFLNNKIGIESVDKNNVKFANNVEFINADSVDENFLLRRWENGDRFIPLGMIKQKKVSDFLTDIKIPTSERKDKLVLLNRNHIVWLVGLRIDDRYKLTKETKKVYKLWIN